MSNLIDRVMFDHPTDIQPQPILNVTDMAILLRLIGFAPDAPEATDQALQKYSGTGRASSP